MLNFHDDDLYYLSQMGPGEMKVERNGHQIGAQETLRQVIKTGIHMTGN